MICIVLETASYSSGWMQEELQFLKSAKKSCWSWCYISPVSIVVSMAVPKSGSN
jgi:hypothetical protein